MNDDQESAWEDVAFDALRSVFTVREARAIAESLSNLGACLAVGGALCASFQAGGDHASEAERHPSIDVGEYMWWPGCGKLLGRNGRQAV